VAVGSAIAEGDLFLIEHRAVAGLSAREAAKLGFPPLAEAVARIAAQGLITRSDFRANLEWTRPTGQPILGAERIGAWLRIGAGLHRVPDALFGLAEAVDALNAAPIGDAAERLAGLARLREVLPPAAAEGLAETTGLVGHMTIAVADAFSLDLHGDGASAKLVPILHSGKG
jgi:hypothetical protein